MAEDTGACEAAGQRADEVEGVDLDAFAVDALGELAAGRTMAAWIPMRCAQAMGMEAFAERARRELIATGEKVRKRDDNRQQLTPQEEQIARLARDGLSNPEIGTQLFISATPWSGTWARCSRSSRSALAGSSELPSPRTISPLLLPSQL